MGLVGSDAARAQHSKIEATHSPQRGAGADIRLRLPTDSGVLVLVRTSLLTLNDAMRSGNFTVMRDLIAPSVREQNSSGRLYQIFSSLMAQRLDLRAVAILTPSYSKPPAIGTDGLLRVEGYFPGPSARINFNLALEWVGNGWSVHGLSVTLGLGRASQPSPASQPVPTIPALPVRKTFGENPRASP